MKLENYGKKEHGEHVRKKISRGFAFTWKTRALFKSTTKFCTTIMQLNSKTKNSIRT